MNDEKLTGGTEYNSRGRKPADLDQWAENSPTAPATPSGGDAAAAATHTPTGYGASADAAGNTTTGTTNTTVDAGGATLGVGGTEMRPGGSASLGSGDSMDDAGGGSGPLGTDSATARAMGADDATAADNG